MSTIEQTAPETPQTPETQETPDAPVAEPPAWSRLRLVLGAVVLAAFAFWLGARLGPSTVFSSGGGLTDGTWLPTPAPAEAYVGGAVAHPGLYPLAPNARVASLLQQAGGAARNADLRGLNLAAPVRDGATITVPQRHGKVCH
jgi:hypothetical protein